MKPTLPLQFSLPHAGKDQIPHSPGTEDSQMLGVCPGEGGASLYHQWSIKKKKSKDRAWIKWPYEKINIFLRQQRNPTESFQFQDVSKQPSNIYSVNVTKPKSPAQAVKVMTIINLRVWKTLVHNYQFTKLLSVQKITSNFHHVVSMLCSPQLEIKGHL